METISTFIDGGGSVLVAASSDIGRSDLRCSGLPPFLQEAWRALQMEAARLSYTGWSLPGREGGNYRSIQSLLACDQTNEMQALLRAGNRFSLFLSSPLPLLSCGDSFLKKRRHVGRAYRLIG